MNIAEELKNFFLEFNGNETDVTEPRWNKNGNGVVYINVNHPEHGCGKVRCRLAKKLDNEIELVSVSPMKRFNENSQYPWDSTIKSVYSVFSSIPGVGGVANRNVNRSLI